MRQAYSNLAAPPPVPTTYFLSGMTAMLPWRRDCYTIWVTPNREHQRLAPRFTPNLERAQRQASPVLRWLIQIVNNHKVNNRLQKNDFVAFLGGFFSTPNWASVLLGRDKFQTKFGLIRDE